MADPADDPDDENDSDDVLAHPVRRVIYETIRGDPGIHPQGIAERLDRSWAVVRYHVAVLEKAEHVVTRRRGRRLHVFGADAVRTVDPNVVIALHYGAKSRILREILAQPDRTAAGLAEALDVSPPTITHHVDDLERWGIVAVRRDGRAQRLRIAKPVQEAVETALEGDSPGNVEND